MIKCVINLQQSMFVLLASSKQSNIKVSKFLIFNIKKKKKKLSHIR